MKTDGFLVLVLHAHLPYIRYPANQQHLEEYWLYEAITESYIPLLNIFEDLLNERTDFRITLSLTPTLIEMFNDELLMRRFELYLDNRIELAERELARTKHLPRLYRLAEMYHSRFMKSRYYFRNVCSGNILNTFRIILNSGQVELITSAATHAYLPLHMSEPLTIRTQLKLGRDVFRHHLNAKPSGIWLPECGYAAGLDKYIKKTGLKYCFLESHGLLGGTPVSQNSVYLPVRTNSGIFVFGRDTESSKQVWSSAGGYPGDPDYRDFYRDIGFDLDPGYLRPYLPGGIRTFTGMKYFRITGSTEEKKLYDPEQGLRKAALHAEHFMNEREKQVQFLGRKLNIRPVITAAYDAELFGHWWHEGPEWLRFVLRNPSLKKRSFRFITPSEYLDSESVAETIAPAASSWGQKGYSSVWIDTSNSWIYRHLGKAAKLMADLAEEHKDADGLLRRCLNQALRELLLAQASDWPFMMKMGRADRFAEAKFREHIGNFFMLCGDVYLGKIKVSSLEALEKKTPLFRNIDFRSYAR